jgi:hypothetical protein
MRGHVRPVANRQRQSINKVHSTSHLQSSKKRLGAIQSSLHHIKPSIGVGFKILVGAPLFFPLDGKTKGGVVVGVSVGINTLTMYVSDQTHLKLKEKTQHFCLEFG